jgi:hypothetical protein
MLGVMETQISKPKVEVHQIFYREDQRPQLEASFLPFDNSGNRFPEQFEYRVFVEQAEHATRSSEVLTGYVSWKFRQKTRITGERFIHFVESNPGYDTYFINPFPAEAIYGNVWLQGERFHPGLIDFTQSIFNKTGTRVDLRSLVNGISTTAFCNYWVGDRRFWQKYMDFTRPIYDYLVNEATDEEKAFLWQSADKKIRASYFPFIFERMFSTLISIDKEIKSLPFTYSTTELDNFRLPTYQRRFVKASQALSRSGLNLLEKPLRSLVRSRHCRH